VKAGAIIPRAETALSTAEQNGDLIIHVYSGADGEFTYYNDSGDGYGYEKGDYEVHNLRYSDNEKSFSPAIFWIVKMSLSAISDLETEDPHCRKAMRVISF
jgi:alpha-glucosidase (family GH31 glycosyl hydrolase)